MQSRSCFETCASTAGNTPKQRSSSLHWDGEYTPRSTRERCSRLLSSMLVLMLLPLLSCYPAMQPWFRRKREVTQFYVSAWHKFFFCIACPLIRAATYTFQEKNVKYKNVRIVRIRTYPYVFGTYSYVFVRIRTYSHIFNNNCILIHIFRVQCLLPTSMMTCEVSQGAGSW